MAQFMLLIYGDPANAPELNPEEEAAQFEAWTNYTNSLVASGAMVSGAPLEGTDQAVTLRARNGELQRSEGAAVDTQEMLGGFYVVEAADLAAAESLAAQVPNIGYGSVEVRPVVVFPDSP